MSQLIERHDGFAYDYRMRCQCGGVVAVTADTYFRESSVEALVPCTRCGEDVHFGPAVAALRDESDPALIDQNVNRFAWYHTSTWRDWPSSDHAEVAASTARITARQFHLDEEGMVTRATTLALHVGTYEAAIENVLRRIHDQGDALSQFFLRLGTRTAPPPRMATSCPSRWGTTIRTSSVRCSPLRRCRRYGAAWWAMASKIGRARCSSDCEPPRSLGGARAP